MCLKGGLTVSVTGGWGEKARKRKTAKAQKKPQKRAESQPSGARIVRRFPPFAIYSQTNAPKNANQMKNTTTPMLMRERYSRVARQAR